MAAAVKNTAYWAFDKLLPSQVPPVDLCDFCGNAPKCIENGRKHPYCSRTCARKAGGSTSSSSSPPARLRRGSAAGKHNFAIFRPEVHAREDDRLVRVEPQLRELRPEEKSFKNLQAQFCSKWDPPGAQTSPSLEKVYEIFPSRDALRFEHYMTVNHTFEKVRSFHSSLCLCDLGTKGAVLCSSKSCGICQIVKSRFKSFAFGALSNTGRFGDGIYSYRNPALADVFATSCTSSPYRVMIVCDVVVEPRQTKVDKLTEEKSLFVPTTDAILPVYIIMYNKWDKGKLRSNLHTM